MERGAGPPRRRGRGALPQAGHPRRDADRRQRRAAARAGRHRDRGQPHRRDPGRRHARPAAPAGREPRDAAHEIDATGMYVLPGFVDTHGHNGDPAKAPNPATATSCGSRTASPACAACPLFRAEQPSLDDKRAAPPTASSRRACSLMPCSATPGMAARSTRPEQARAWVRWAAKAGYDGVKLFNDEPRAVTAAAIDEARQAQARHRRASGAERASPRSTRASPASSGSAPSPISTAISKAC
jgi:hypothetical protein